VEQKSTFVKGGAKSTFHKGGAKNRINLFFYTLKYSGAILTKMKL
jgi:hypothetical protein